MVNKECWLVLFDSVAPRRLPFALQLLCWIHVGSHEVGLSNHASIAWSFGIVNLIGQQHGVYNGPLQEKLGTCLPSPWDCLGSILGALFVCDCVGEPWGGVL